MSVTPFNIGYANAHSVEELVQPIRVIAKVGGKLVVPKNFEINANGHGTLDTGTLALPIKGNPDWCIGLKEGKTLEVYIRAGFPSNPNQPPEALFPQLSQRFSGTADPISPRFEDDTCTLNLRSFGAILSATKTTTNLGSSGAVNLSAVTTLDYIKHVAATHGFTVDSHLSHAPATMQQVYNQNLIVGVKNIYIWDILMYCAETDGVFIWVSDKTIHYADPESVTRPIIHLRWLDELNSPKAFEGNHSPQFAKDIQVIVRSYMRRKRQAYRSSVRSTIAADGSISNIVRTSSSVSYTQQNFGNPGESTYGQTFTSGSSGSGSSATTGGSSVTTGGASQGTSGFESDANQTKYIFDVSGHDQAWCDSYALQKWKYLSYHTYTATFTLPVRAELFKQMNITTKYFVSGLPWSSFDQGYIPKRMTERFDNETNGYEVDIDGINHRLPMNAV